MRKVLLLVVLFPSLLWGQVKITSPSLKGSVYRFVDMKGTGLLARNVDVWVPANFDSSGLTKYAVLYMHDGQNLFFPEASFAGITWGMDKTMDSLLRLNQIRPTIVVGIWNTQRRFIEYNPKDAYAKLDSINKIKLNNERPGGSDADAYLDFVFNTLKPIIDARFPTRPEMKQTFMMGSSMGALISLYALCKYSEYVKSVACLSTHWPVSLKENNAAIANTYQNYFIQRLPNPKNHQIYFDHGTETLDAWYGAHQDRMDSLCRESGYDTIKSFLSLTFQGAAHNETAWRSRVAWPLIFMLKP
jgi:predicted alpha/beta superfamily hydrolase